MLTIQFIEQNLHFIISLFAALVFFAVFWLYFDAWSAERHKLPQDTYKWVGFLLVALSFVPYATLIEQDNFGTSLFGNATTLIAGVMRMAGYLAIIIGQILDPLQEVPKNSGLCDVYKEEEKANRSRAQKHLSPGFGMLGGTVTTSLIVLPIAAFGIATLYWRRATTGLERHVRPVAYAFLILTVFESLTVVSSFRTSTNPVVFDLLKAFGPVWIIAHILLVAATLILGRWVWQYLTERFLSQLFMTFTTVVLIVFMVTTVCFTFLLLRNIQDDALNNLSTATSVLNYALNSKKSVTLANADAVAANPAIVQAIGAKDHNNLLKLTSTYLENSHETSLIVTNADGQVLLRAEDPDRWGDSISSDTLVRRSLIGSSNSSVETLPSVIAPVVRIRSTVPVRDGNNLIAGTISVATVIDNAFLDGIKRSTGLDASIYSDNIRSATTFAAPDGTSRWVGIMETSAVVRDNVLRHGETYQGQLSILNRDYLAVYAPLKDADNTVLGMLFVGKTEASVLKTTAYLISLTFIVSAMLLVISIVPAYFVARYMTDQLQ